MLTNYALAIALALVGYFLLLKLKFPAPTLIGPMLAIGICQIFGLVSLTIPGLFTSLFQIVIGINLGARVQRQQLKAMKSYLLPSLLVVAWSLMVAISLSFVLSSLVNLDWATCFFGAAPGGIVEMSLMAISFQANVPVVAMFQSIRVALIVIAIPLIIVSLKTQREVAAATVSQKRAPAIGRQEILLATGGIIIAAVFLRLGVPAGGLIGASLGTGGLNLLLNKTERAVIYPPIFRTAAEIGLGMSIGLMFTPEIIAQLLTITKAALIFLAGIVINVAALTAILHKMLKQDWITSLLCAAPAGLSQMIVLSDALGKDSIAVSYFQILRLFSVILLIPVLYHFLA